MPFKWNNKEYLPVLECKVNPEKFQEFPSTVKNYDKDDKEKIEWRVEDPMQIMVVAVLIIPENRKSTLNNEEFQKIRTALASV